MVKKKEKTKMKNVNIFDKKTKRDTALKPERLLRLNDAKSYTGYG